MPVEYMHLSALFVRQKINALEASYHAAYIASNLFVYILSRFSQIIWLKSININCKKLTKFAPQPAW